MGTTCSDSPQPPGLRGHDQAAPVTRSFCALGTQHGSQVPRLSAVPETASVSDTGQRGLVPETHSGAAGLSGPSRPGSCHPPRPSDPAVRQEVPQGPLGGQTQQPGSRLHRAGPQQAAQPSPQLGQS